VAALVVSGSAVAATTQLSNDRGMKAIDRLPALVREDRDHPFVRAFGLDPATARPALVAASGVRVASVRDAGAACLMVSDGDDQCYLAANIAGGRGYSIGNDCSAGSGYPMRVLGVAPYGTAKVVIDYSSGPPLAATPRQNAFLIETTTPRGADPYPVAISYLGAAGQLIASDPVRDGQDLCLRPGKTP
jgi:hypothetical protein